MPNQYTAARYLIDRACEICGCPFVAKAFDVRRGYGRFCGKKCWSESRRRKDRVDLICQRCTAAFSTHKSHPQTFCSWECYAATWADLRTPITDRLWANVQKTNECWLWTGHVAGKGYGVIGSGGHGGAQIYTHRFALEEALGAPLPDGYQACHTCDTPRCVRNDDPGTYVVNGIAHPRRGHLWLGTQADNLADMSAKGRGRGQSGPS